MSSPPVPPRARKDLLPEVHLPMMTMDTTLVVGGLRIATIFPGVMSVGLMNMAGVLLARVVSTQTARAGERNLQSMRSHVDAPDRKRCTPCQGGG